MSEALQATLFFALFVLYILDLVILKYVEDIRDELRKLKNK